MQRKWLGALAVTLLFPAAGMAQMSASATATASVTVQHVPITLTRTADLSFGTIVPFGAAGTVIVSPTASPSTTGSNVTIVAQGNPARFSVTGNKNNPFSITLPPNGTVTVTSGGNSMEVNTFRSSTGSSDTLDAAGTASFAVGATLSVGANQPAGTYAGSFTVTVAYL